MDTSILSQYGCIIINTAAGFSGARPGQLGRGAPPARSSSLDGGMGPNPSAGRPFPPQHRNNAPYSLLQQKQQQQGMMGTSMASQAVMANSGQAGEEIPSCNCTVCLKMLLYCCR